MVFDLRLRHRGTANSSQKDRAIVYMSYVAEWYYDRVNFKESQTAKFDDFSPQMKKLFSRQDHLAYVAKLEELLESKKVDLKALRSKGLYKQVELEA